MERAKFKRQALLSVAVLAVAVAILALVRDDWTTLPIVGFYAVANLGRYLLWDRFPDGMHPPNESTLQWLRKGRAQRSDP